MLLTITTTNRPATDLGYLLHKHPGRLQTFGPASEQAHVCYPEAIDERCTAALLLEVAPIGRHVGVILRGGYDGSLRATVHRVVDLTDPGEEAAAAAWWEELTARGGAGWS